MRGAFTPRLVCLSILLAGLTFAATPASASAVLDGPPELRQASPEFGLAQYGWASQWVELHFRQPVDCAAWCYSSYEWIVAANPAPLSGPAPDGSVPGALWSGYAYLAGEDDGIHNAVAYFYAQWIGTRAVQVATRSSWNEPWTLSNAIAFEMLPHTDLDGDYLVDGIEARICRDPDYGDPLSLLVDMECAGDDLTMEGMAVLTVPRAPVRSGDADGDGFAETIRLTGTKLRLPGWGVEGIGWKDVAFDVREGGRRADALPLPYPFTGSQAPVLCMPLPHVAGVGVTGDPDQDGVPTLVNIVMSEACVDRRYSDDAFAYASASAYAPVDPDNAVADPATQYPLALGEFEVYTDFSPDADGDGLPAGAQVMLARPILTEWWDLDAGVAWQKIAWDADDTDADFPFPLVTTDADQDDVPDAAEPALCLIIDTPRYTDGHCRGYGTDFVPSDTYRSSFRAPAVYADADGDLVSDAAEAASCHSYARIVAMPFGQSLPPCPVAPNVREEVEAALEG